MVRTVGCAVAWGRPGGAGRGAARVWGRAGRNGAMARLAWRVTPWSARC